ncbi:MAG: hypothetical protein C6I00_05005 [Nitratiruptor sp.]|nr:hypothetical protein [Nitratiruptor sp.]NPA84269.1 hypothetical protein [Campylobacterota bacterium]
MSLDLEDFSSLPQEEPNQKEQGSQEEEQKLLQLQEECEQRVRQLENEYKELLGKVGKESYEQGFRDAQEKYQELLQQEIERISQEKEAEKEAALSQIQSSLHDVEEELQRRYREYLNKFTDIIVDSLGEILDFLYIDKRNSPIIQGAMEKLLEDFHNFLPLTIQVSPQLYHQLQEKFSGVSIKENPELEEHDFIIEFHDFKIENRIKEKLGVIKDEIKRETKKLT